MKKEFIMVLFIGLSVSAFSDYYICYGSFRQKENAFAEAAALKTYGIDATVAAFDLSGGRLFRVIHPKGYADRDSAKWKLKYITAGLDREYPTQKSFWVFESSSPAIVETVEAPVAEAVEETAVEAPVAETVEETAVEAPVAEAVEETAVEEPVTETVEETISFSLEKDRNVRKTLFDAPADVYAVIPSSLTAGQETIYFTVNLYRDKQRIASKTGDLISDLNFFSVADEFPEAAMNGFNRTCEYTVELILGGEVLAESSFLYFNG